MINQMEYLGTDMMKGQAENWNKHHLIHSKFNKKFKRMLSTMKFEEQ